ncbi:MAG: DUF4010 domain-containing protein [Terriglobia bacterium]
MNTCGPIKPYHASGKYLLWPEKSRQAGLLRTWLLEIGLVAPSLLPVAFRPIVLLMFLHQALLAAACGSGAESSTEMPVQDNPSELKSALTFAAVYAIVVFAVAAGKHLFGERGLYVIAALSGLTDMDAITLS